MTSAPNASSSPVAQSMTSPAAIAARRSSSGLSRGCMVKEAGRLTWVSMIRLTVSPDTAVGTAWWLTGRSSGSGGLTVPGSAGRSAASLVSVKARSSCCW